MRRSLLVPLTLLAIAAGSSAVGAQTNDHVYRSWRWEEDPGSPRSAGLAGAFVAIADDASASLSNPAGLVQHPRHEAMGSLLQRNSGTVGPGDALASRTGLGLVGGSLELGPRLAIGGTWSEPRDVRVSLARADLPNATFDAGFLDAQVRSLAFGAAYAVTNRLRLGAGISHGRLELQGVNAVMRRGETLTEIQAEGSDSALSASFGALYDVSSSVKVGLAARTGATWEIARSAFSPAEGRVVDPGSVYRLRAPDVFSAAAAWRLPSSFRVTGQIDLVRYSQIRDALDVRRDIPRSDYVLDDGIEARVGIEWAHVFDPLTLQLRGGLWSQAPGSIEYVGPEPSERMTFLGSSRRLREGVGASVLFKSGLSMDAGALFGGDRTLILAGARYRF
jgi:hypothetical protein